MRRTLLMVLGVALLAAFVSVGPAWALACGDVVTKNVKLKADLDCSGAAPGTVALTVGADKVKIDLKGYSIIGPATATACPSFSGQSDGTRGIVIEGFDDVKVQNGVITGFERGIRVKDAVGVRIKDIEAYNNAFSAVRVRENAEVRLDKVYFHDNLNDAMGVSAGSYIRLEKSRIEDNCASGVFLFPPAGPLPGAMARIKRNDFIGNYRSAINFWTASGSAERNFIQGNNSDSTYSSSSDFGQISVINHGGSGDVEITCNEIRDSVDANGAIERAIGVRRSLTPGGYVLMAKNLIANNPTGVWFSKDGTFAPVTMYRNTFDGNTLAIDFDPGATGWTVDAPQNYLGTDPYDAGGGSNVLTLTELDKPKHCKSAGAP